MSTHLCLTLSSLTTNCPYAAAAIRPYSDYTTNCPYPVAFIIRPSNRRDANFHKRHEQSARRAKKNPAEFPPALGGV